MRNYFGAEAVSQRAYFENVTLNAQLPQVVIPKLLEQVRPVHQVVKVDVFVPGCPPDSKVIRYVVEELLRGREPDPSQRTHFG
jgi:NAD-reducing hydrogenase small subunit